MAFFAMPYRVLFDDTMAYGSHHFLTNFKFQCAVREHFYFTQIADVNPDDKELENLVLLTQEGYSRNLAPVLVGGRVGLLLSIEDHTRSSVRMCFRAVREDGKPVCCGYQSLVCTSKQTGEVIVAQEPLLYALVPLREKLRAPSFQERVLAGGTTLKAIFDEEAIRLGTAVARQTEARIVPDVLIPPPPRRGSSAAVGKGVVLTFPGQGSWEPGLLQEVCRIDPEARRSLEQADEITRRLLGIALRPLVQGDRKAVPPDRYPDLVQVATFLTSVLCARYLLANGVIPHLLLGHSAGELAALAVGGAYDVATGTELVCHRVQALRSLKGLDGGMIALGCDERTAGALVEAAAASSLEVSVVNHYGQTVVSGTSEDLQRLTTILKARQLNATRLKSPYPFHSQLLRGAVAPFAAALKTLSFKPLTVPVYSAMGLGLYPRDSDLPDILAAHFVQHLFFPSTLEDAYALGGRVFIECGGGRVLTGLAQQTFRDWPGVTAHALSVAEGSAGELPRLAEIYGGSRSAPAPAAGITQLASAPTRAATVSEEKPAQAEPPSPLPIAVVALGCVLPGAPDPDALWSNLLSGKSGIIDVAPLDPVVAADFCCAGPVQSDKTYTLLSGRASVPENCAAAPRYTPEEWAQLAAVGRFLAAATGQCLAGLKATLPAAERICCVLGSTGDGSAEYDELLLLATAEEMVRAGTAPAESKENFCQALEKALGRTFSNAGERVPLRSYSTVARRLLGDGVQVLAVDAACASSLYAIGVGIGALREGRCDVAFCGGAFAPGVANTCLFAQFQGLSATGSRPLDAAADGVVFGEGAALVVLKRLPDALAAGDRIHAILRGVGASSDGKSPSVMEPRKEGQVLAMRRAASHCGVSPGTLQYIDAHATATPVGDAVEFGSLREVVGPRPVGAPPIHLGSFKALLGHTGWVAGAASIIALCKALEHRTFPPQRNFSAPNPQFALASSPFVIETEAKPWPANVDGLPRRAGINGFGFGGCDAHLILEEFQPDYHQARCAASPRLPAGDQTAIVGFKVLFPADRESASASPRWQFAPGDIKLPESVRILPDVADHMDRSHILAVRAMAEIVSRLPKSWEGVRSDTGVVVGFAGKTRRGVEASLRVYLDHLLRRLAELRPALAPDDPYFDTMRDEFVAVVRRLLPSGRYTLPGLMPNVIAGRLANAFHLTGPNMVLDADQASLYESLREAQRLLQFGECKLVVAGGISGCAGPDIDRVVHASEPADRRPTGEAVILLALASATIAAELGLPVLGHLSCASTAVEPSDTPVCRAGAEVPVRLQGAEGTVELANALERVTRHGGSAAVEWTDPVWPRTCRVRVTGVTATSPPLAPAGPAGTDAHPDETVPPEVAGLLAVPVRWTTPKWAPEELASTSPGRSSEDRAVLVLTDQPAWALAPAVKAALGKRCYRLVCPAVEAPAGTIAIDLSGSATMEQSLRQLDGVPYEAVLALKDLEGLNPLDSVTGPSAGTLLDLLFAVARHAYPRVEQGTVSVGAVCLHSEVSGSVLHPYTGLVSGFLRSLSRELPNAVCKQVNVSDGDLSSALGLLEAELEQGKPPAPIEVSYLGGRRHVCVLTELDPPVAGAPLLDKDSVVVAVGGARGITAVLAEAVLRCFGCTVTVLGRTDPDAVPPEFLSLDDETFERTEPEFYKKQLALSPGARVPELKRRYDQYRSGREVAANLQRLCSLPGRVKYLRADVTDEAAVDAALRQVAADFGRLDMLLHGAGIQTSKVLSKKSLEDFRAILRTKLGGLGNLIRACRRHFPECRVHFHPITSAFSQIGNAGQQDYGAANVALDRAAEYMHCVPGPWDASSLGWLGWLRVGMTRGSEYATMAVVRRLRPIPRAEGGALFEKFLSGRPVVPTLSLMSDLEARAFHIRLAEVPKPRAAVRERTWTLSPETHPFLRDHLLNGVATLPGAFAVELAIRTVGEFHPGMHIQHLATVSIDRFIKFPEGRPFVLRAVAEVLEEGPETVRTRLRFLSDFVHASGQVLQKDIVHFSAEMLLTAGPRPVTGRGPLPPVYNGWRLPDPYLHPTGPLLMDGPFRRLHDIKLGSSHSAAVFRWGDIPVPPAMANALTPFVLLDALWRFSAVRREEDGTVFLCVPLRCGRLDVLPGVDQQALARQECFLTCSPPRLEGEHILVDWAEAADASGRVIFAVRDIVGRIYGKVPGQAEPLPAETPIAATATGNGHLAPTAGSRASPAADTRPATPFAGKVALVTGSGRGIGKVIALRLADLGAQVVVNSFHSREQGERTAAEASARGGEAIHVWGSVANQAHLQRIFDEIDTRCGGLDFLVSNASAGVFAPLQQVTPEHWDRCFRTNVTALHQASLLAAQRMRRRGGGKIVALSSVGTQLCFDYFGCVGPVKAAVECLVRYLAAELAADCIQVNAVTAGPVYGELLDAHPDRPRWEKLAPRGSFSTEEEVAEAVLYLLGSDGMNGAALVVDAALSLRLCESAS
jgi:acyl transferase domain-containing protein/NAD(P)-dependent dehydrogenase (short-subunit alcohol dehydrogenase family)/acyl-CoA thioesterase FadM